MSLKHFLDKHNYLIPALPVQGPRSSPAQGPWGGLVVDIPTTLFTRHQGA